MTNPNAWTGKDVEQLLIEAAKTLQLCPNVRGPVWSQPSMWSEYKDGYAHPKKTKVKLLPGRDAISRMEATWDWVNELPDEELRQILYGWSRAWARKGDSVEKFAARSGISYRTLRRRVERGCSIIAYNLRQKKYVRLTMADFKPESRANHPTLKKYALHWMAPGAKPIFDPELLDRSTGDQPSKIANKRTKQRGGRMNSAG